MIHNQAAKKWAAVSANSGGPSSKIRAHFFKIPQIVHHINAKICGVASGGEYSGLHREIARLADGRIIDRAISVGCGAGIKEMELIRHGIVSHFTLVDIVESRREAGISYARMHGIEEKINFVTGDAFEMFESGRFDLVYWNTALHHMPDTRLAIQWSKDRLGAGGIFAMQEYVGANRLQFPPTMVDVANQFRAGLPDRFFAPLLPERPPIPRKVVPKSVEQWLKEDPSECQDSENILPALRDVFDVTPTLTGGAIYMVALQPIIAHFRLEEDADKALLSTALLADDLCIKAGMNLCGSAIFEVS